MDLYFHPGVRKTPWFTFLFGVPKICGVAGRRRVFRGDAAFYPQSILEEENGHHNNEGPQPASRTLELETEDSNARAQMRVED